MKINLAFACNRRIIWLVGYLLIALLIGFLHEDAYQEEQHGRHNLFKGCPKIQS